VVWIDEQGLEFATVRQDDIDLWLMNSRPESGPVQMQVAEAWPSKSMSKAL
jgi:hypothetical protein